MVKTINQVYRDQYRTKRRQRLAIKLAIILLLLGGLVGGALYAWFWSGWLRVDQVAIASHGSLSATDITAVATAQLNRDWLFIPRRNNYWLVNTGSITQELTKRFPSARDIQVTKSFSHQLTIALNSREAIGTWCVNQRDCFYFDKEGKAFALALPATGVSLLNVEDQRSGQATNLGGSVADAETLDWLLTMKHGLDGLTLGFGKVILPAEDRFLTEFITSENWRLRAALNQPASDQLRALATVLETKLASAEARSSLQYIDVQLSNRVYYR